MRLCFMKKIFIILTLIPAITVAMNNNNAFEELLKTNFIVNNDRQDSPFSSTTVTHPTLNSNSEHGAWEELLRTLFVTDNSTTIPTSLNSELNNNILNNTSIIVNTQPVSLYTRIEHRAACNFRTAKVVFSS